MPKQKSCKRQVSLVLSLLIFMQYPAAAPASNSSNINEKLAQYEKTLFGQTREQLPTETRLRALEVNLFTKLKKGSTERRLDAIAKALGSLSSSSLFPPLAPTLDKSAFLPDSLQMPPSYVTATAQQDGYSSASPPQETQQQTTYGTSSATIKELLQQGLHKHSQGQLAESEKTFQRVLTIDPSNSDANFSLGVIAEDKGNLVSALSYYKIALATRPYDPELKNAFATTQAKLEQQQLHKFTDLQRQRDLELKRLADRAAAAYKEGKFDNAIEALSRIVSEKPSDANAHYALSQAFKGKNDLYRARQHLSHALEIAPNNELYLKAYTELNKIETAANSPLAHNYDNNAPAGQILPFTRTQNDSYGDTYSLGYSDGLIYPGSPEAGLAFGLSLGRESPSLYNSKKTIHQRLTRVLGASVAGAALGAFANHNRPGGMKQGALRGAAYGGLFGLFTSL